MTWTPYNTGVWRGALNADHIFREEDNPEKSLSFYDEFREKEMWNAKEEGLLNGYVWGFWFWLVFWAKQDVPPPTEELPSWIREKQA